MKVTLTKEEKINGEVFYYVYVNKKLIDNFLESKEDRDNHLDGQTLAKTKAEALVNKLVHNKGMETIVTTLQEIEID